MRRHIEPLVGLLDDKEAEVRSQACKLLGDGKVASVVPKLLVLLEDSEPRVRFFAAQALGKLGKQDAFTPLLALVRRSADADPWLRHAAVVALAACGNGKSLATAATDASVPVRRAALLALRRQGSAEVARFLEDPEPELVLEAARAINDVPIDSAMPKLAGLINRSGMSDPLGYRVLNANFRLGKEENARAVARFAARSDVPADLRVEALRELSLWAKPPGRDRIMGVWRPLAPRPNGIAAEALRPALGGIFTGPNSVRKEAAKVAADLGIKEIGPTLYGLAMDGKRPAEVRVESLRALAALKDKQLDTAVRSAIGDGEPRVRAEGRRILATTNPVAALTALSQALDEGSAVEKQLGFDVLGEMKGNPQAVRLLDQWLDRLIAGKVQAGARLDLVEAAERQGSEALRKKLARYESVRPKSDPLGKWRDSLEGGDAVSGKRIFLYKSEVSCLRCHKAAGEGVGEVGPDLTGIGGKQKRDYLLESIVDPNKQIAKGFETVELTLTSGQIRSGILKSEDATAVRLMTPEGAPGRPQETDRRAKVWQIGDARRSDQAPLAQGGSRPGRIPREHEGCAQEVTLYKRGKDANDPSYRFMRAVRPGWLVPSGGNGGGYHRAALRGHPRQGAA